MLSQLLARVSPNTARRKCAPPRRFRLTVEALEGRDVPVSLTWVGDGTYTFMSSVNWSPSQTPASGDDLYFDGSKSLVGAAMITPPTIVFNSIHLVNGYTGTVSIYNTGTFAEIELTKGTIQLTGSDISVSSKLTWTGGNITISSGSVSRTVHILSGATATCTPGAGNTVSTGATLSFESTGGTGSQGTFNPGNYTFTNGADLDVNAYSTVELKPTEQDKVNLKAVGAGSQLNVKGGMAIGMGGIGGDLEMPLYVSGGIFTIRAPSTYSFSGLALTKADLPADPGAGSVEMSSGRIEIQHGATLKATGNGVKVSGGTLATIKNGDAAQSNAVIDGKLTNSGAIISILYDATVRKVGTGTVFFGILEVKKTFDWTAGTYTPAVYAPGHDVNKADRILAREAITANTGGSGTVAPIAIDGDGKPNIMNPVPGQSWIILVSDASITGANPPNVIGKWDGLFPSPAPDKNWAVVGKA